MRATWFSWVCAFAIVTMGAGCSSSSDSNGGTDQTGGESGGGTGGNGTGGSGTGGSGNGTGGSGTGGSGSETGGSGTGGTETGPCALVDCIENSRCVEDGDEASCECLPGFEMDADACVDVDECADVTLNDCDLRASCSNTKGGFTCTCDAPAYTGDGKSCDCAEGFSPDSDDPSLCLADNGVACGDDLDCGSGFCVDAVCCSSGCLTPPACGTPVGATCTDGETCEYPVADNGTECDDGDACTTATCNAGQCEKSGDVSCDLGNPCLAAACDRLIGCSYIPVAGPCDDGDPCTTGDACDGAGACVPGVPVVCDDSNPCTDDACAPTTGQCTFSPNTASCGAPNTCATSGQCQAGACTPVGNACGANATSCSVGTPNQCSCASGFVDGGNGRCVPQTDECATAQNPCVAQAACEDPSSNAGDAQCTCPLGFTGNGRAAGTGCTDINECAGDPCGISDGWATACTQPDPGTYACVCAAGYTQIGGSCVCDMEGTFAVRVTAQLTYEPAVPSLLEGYADVTVHSYILRTHTLDAQGQLQVTERPCGGETPDTCTQPNVLFFGREAYGGNIPDSAWDASSIPALRSSVPAAAAVPGAAFQTAEDAMVLGVTLANPTGPWPATADDVTTWSDPDGDGALGMTTVWKDTGTSSACSRVNTSAARYDYELPPAPTFNRMTRVYGASRVIKAYDGTFDSCDTLTGSVTGPDNGQYKADARVWGCVRENGTACTTAERDFFDGATTDSPYVTSATFVMKRMPAGQTHTCAQVRSFTY